MVTWVVRSLSVMWESHIEFLAPEHVGSEPADECPSQSIKNHTIPRFLLPLKNLMQREYMILHF